MYYVTKYNNNNASYTTLFSWSSIWLLVLRLSLSSKISALVVLHRISMVCSWWIITSKVACGLNSTVYFQFLMMPWAKSLSKASGYLKLTHARPQCPALNAHCKARAFKVINKALRKNPFLHSQFNLSQNHTTDKDCAGSGEITTLKMPLLFSCVWTTPAHITIGIRLFKKLLVLPWLDQPHQLRWPCSTMAKRQRQVILSSSTVIPIYHHSGKWTSLHDHLCLGRPKPSAPQHLEMLLSTVRL